MYSATFNFNSSRAQHEEDVYYVRVAPPASALTLLSAASRLTHGAAGTFDIAMPLTGTSGVEDRVAGTYNAVFTFDAPVTSGQVQVTLTGQSAPSTIGQLHLAVFPNEAGLDAQGDNLYLQTSASGAPVTGNPATAGFGSVMQGFIETSNVNVVTEITNLITAQRAYEMNSKVVSASDEMMSNITNLK